jgi:hypothetical protein
MSGIFGRLRTIGRLKTARRPEGRPQKTTPKKERKRTYNLFEAAAVYVSAYAEDNQEQIDEAASWVSPEALSFGVNELACRAVVALARERDESPQAVARTLLGLPAA